MSLASVLQYLRPGLTVGTEADGCSIIKRGDDVEIQWRDGRPQPTAQEIADAQSDPLYLAWLVEHGGDAEATALRQARERIDAAEVDVRLLVAVTQVLLAEINTLREQHSLAPRTISQVKAAVKARLQ